MQDITDIHEFGANTNTFNTNQYQKHKVSSINDFNPVQTICTLHAATSTMVHGGRKLNVCVYDICHPALNAGGNPPTRIITIGLARLQGRAPAVTMPAQHGRTQKASVVLCIVWHSNAYTMCSV